MQKNIKRRSPYPKTYTDVSNAYEEEASYLRGDPSAISIAVIPNDQISLCNKSLQTVSKTSHSLFQCYSEKLLANKIKMKHYLELNKCLMLRISFKLFTS